MALTGNSVTQLPVPNFVVCFDRQTPCALVASPPWRSGCVCCPPLFTYLRCEEALDNLGKLGSILGGGVS